MTPEERRRGQERIKEDRRGEETTDDEGKKRVEEKKFVTGWVRKERTEGWSEDQLGKIKAKKL